MRLVLISDTHGRHREITPIPDGDVLIHAGDGLCGGTFQELASLNAWFGEIKPRFPHILYVAGNHDRIFESQPDLARATLTNAIYLQDSGIEINGVKFYGSPWTPEFCDWAFNLPRFGPELAAKWDLIPPGTDVVITHGPPHGIGDFIPNQNVNEGCRKLLFQLVALQPALHVCGHIHEGYGERAAHGIRFVNAAVLDGQYRLVNAPIVVDL